MTKKVTKKDLLITFKNFDKQHLRNLAKQEKVINEIYIKALNDAIMSSAFVKGNETDSDKPLNWAHYPLASKQLDKAIAEYVGKLETAIKEGNQREWMLAVKKNNEVIDHLTKNGKITKEQVEAWKSPNIDAMEAFQQRKNEKGMNLSDRVWKVGKQMRQELEMALELGIGEGKSAADLSKDVRKYLKQPDKLFRRVRDKYGNLRLSKAAAAYHPGQGVYRSSYKNAMRMTTSENNMAYRASDHQKWQGLDFVIGYKVQLSNNHTVNGKPLKDICDKLQGDYPKNFNFKGWHPFCRCFATPILASWEEQLKVMKMQKDGQNVSNYKYKGEIHDVPQNFKDWISENSDRIQRAKSKPYFIQDNYKDGNIKNGLDLTNDAPAVHVRSREEILAEANKRHAQRTAEQVKEAQYKWNERLLKNAGLLDNVVSLKDAIRFYELDSNALEKTLSNKLQSKDGKFTQLESVIKKYNDVIEYIKNEASKNKKALRTLRERTNSLGAKGRRISKRIEEAIKSTPKTLASNEIDVIISKLKREIEAVEQHRTEIKKAWNARKQTMARNISATSSITEQQKQQEAEIEKVLGIKKGKEMTFDEANHMRGNPYYQDKYIEDENGRFIDKQGKRFSLNPKYKKGYTINCQSCVVAHEMRMRGWNVDAFPNTKRDDNLPRILSRDTAQIWVDENGKPLSERTYGVKIARNNSIDDVVKRAEEAMIEVGRYHISIVFKGGFGHIFTAERKSDGTMRYYDPQNGVVLKNLNEYANDMSYYPLRIYRVDNLAINLEMINGIVRDVRKSKR